MTTARALPSNEARVAAIRGATMHAALNDMVIHYRDLGGIMEAFASSPMMNFALDDWMEENHANGEPLYACLVISSRPEALGIPSEGFYNFAERLGYPIRWADPFEKRYAFWFEMRRRCRAHARERVIAQSKKGAT